MQLGGEMIASLCIASLNGTGELLPEKKKNEKPKAQKICMGQHGNGCSTFEMNS
jgi:hypothetical protein